MADDPDSGGATGGPTGLSGRWRRLLDGLTRTDRVRGYPTSSNRASSMHLFWDLPGRFVEVAVTVTVLDEPRTDDLYFWALQVSFEDAATGRRVGAAHTGPQWAAQHPGHGAVNWGGYGERGELDGGPGWMRSATGNANSVDYPWRVGEPYRLRVAPAPPGGGERGAGAGPDGAAAPPGFTAWRATITPPRTGRPQVIRDLWGPGDRLVSPMVWSEVFARCDAPPVRVAWSNPEAIDERGVVHRAETATVNYQAVADGGCSNTDASTSPDVDRPGWVQTTATERRTRPGVRLPLHDRPGGFRA